MQVNLNWNSPGRFCSLASAFHMKMSEFTDKTIKVLLTEMVGQCGDILPQAPSGNILLHLSPTQLIWVII